MVAALICSVGIATSLVRGGGGGRGAGAPTAEGPEAREVVAAPG
jgi:hypothetical protein